MMEMTKARKYLNILILGAVGGTAFFLPYIRYFLFDGQLISMGITAAQSGFLLTIHTIVNIIFYIPGGALADRINPKKALGISLLGTAFLSFLYAFTLDSFAMGLIIWAGLSVTTVGVFWGSLMKAVRIIGTEEEQGLMYGLYYGAQGLFATIVRALALVAYNSAYSGAYGTNAEVTTGFFRAVLTGGAMTIIAALLVFFFFLKVDYKTAIAKVTGNEKSFGIKSIFGLLKNPMVLLCAIIGFIAYGFFTSVSYFTPYLSEVRGVSAVDTGIFGIIRSYGTLMLAPVGGLLVDKVFKSASNFILATMLILVGLFGIAMVLPSGMNQTLVSLFTLLPGIVTMMMYGQAFVTISEAKLSRAITATAIGVISIVAFLPDAIYHPLFGNWIDTLGAEGYNRIFIFLIISGIIGAVVSLIFNITNNKRLRYDYTKE